MGYAGFLLENFSSRLFPDVSDFGMGVSRSWPAELPTCPWAKLNSISAFLQEIVGS
jgi:hypothetical protein